MRTKEHIYILLSKIADAVKFFEMKSMKDLKLIILRSDLALSHMMTIQCKTVHVYNMTVASTITDYVNELMPTIKRTEFYYSWNDQIIKDFIRDLMHLRSSL